MKTDKPPNKCIPEGGIKEIYFLNPDDLENNREWWSEVSSAGTAEVEVSWQEEKTEDAEFEIIEPKQLPAIEK